MCLMVVGGDTGFISISGASFSTPAKPQSCNWKIWLISSTQSRNCRGMTNGTPGPHRCGHVPFINDGSRAKGYTEDFFNFQLELRMSKVALWINKESICTYNILDTKNFVGSVYVHSKMSCVWKTCSADGALDSHRWI